MWIDYWSKEKNNKFRVEVSQIDWICGLVADDEGFEPCTKSLTCMRAAKGRMECSSELEGEFRL